MTTINEWLRSGQETIIHREHLTRCHPDDFVTVADIENAVKRATSWVKRNCRSWPYQHRLSHRIDGDDVIFWWERDTDL